MSKKDISISFDIGVGSVGWAVIDEKTNDILKWGVRLFEQVNKEQAGERRIKRSLRRRIRRMQYRNRKFYRLIVRTKDLFNKNNVDEVKQTIKYLSTKYSNILDLKVKALSEQITSDELIFVLHSYLKHRGYFYVDKDDNNKNRNNEEINKLSEQNNKFPSIIIKEMYDKYKFSRSELYEGKKISNPKWVEEIEHLFNIQKITNEDFKNTYINNLFKAVREFSKGPGSENSPTQYGLYRKNKDGIVEKIGENLWDITTKKCEIFPEEKADLSHSIRYEIFSLLENINNLRFNHIKDWKIDNESKIELLNLIFSKMWESKIKYPTISLELNKNKVLNKSINLYLDKNNLQIMDGGKFNYESIYNLENLFTLIKYIKETMPNISNFISFESLDLFINELDNIISCLYNEQNIEKRIIILKSILKESKIFGQYFNDDFINILANSKKLMLSKVGSYSKKALKMFIDNMLKTSDNSIKIKFDKIRDKTIALKNSFKQTKYINEKSINNFALPSDVKNPMIEAIKVFNKIKKLYSNEWEIKNIYVEMARENNSKSYKDYVNSMLENFTNDKEKWLLKLLEDKNIKEEIYKNNTLEKLILWEQQDHIDIYDGEELDVYQIINNPSYTEIDHIIPYSQSLNNSRSNKVITKSKNNSLKSNELAYTFVKRNSEWFNKYIQKCKDIFNEKRLTKNTFPFTSKKELKDKLDNLLLEDLSSTKQKEFISRNLNDTRYVTKLFINYLKDYSLANNNCFNVSAINGQITSYIRKNAKKLLKNKSYYDWYIKDRNIYSHHAIDASIIGLYLNNSKSSLKNLKIDSLHYELFDDNGETSLVDRLTGEILKFDDFKNSKEAVKLAKINEIVNICDEKITNKYNEIAFSRKPVTNNNKELFNQKLYGLLSLENINYKIAKFNLIKKDERAKNSAKETQPFKNFFGIDPNKKSDLLIYKHSIKEYNKLNEIFLNFKEKKSPFEEYMKDLKEKKIFNGDFIDKLLQAKKVLLIHNNEKTSYSVVKNLKYIDSKVETIFLNKKQNNKSFNENMNWISVLVYKNNKNKYSIIRVNPEIYKFKKEKVNFINEDKLIKEKLNKIKIKNNISLDSKPVMILKKGSIFQRKNDETIWYVTGSNAQRIELNRIDKNKENSNYRNMPSVNVLIDNYIPLEIDILGNIYKK
ncbi:Uncharacterized protein conserved in bacteria [Mycoplasmopsis maculosa]|uniref:CRISPR-associated endonuclease Cas9 n=1 Tax=Mycoplasmopsis maculosa TaxID=114885 RepID=A0A449B4V2_9BACT|nr:type II CRISPR RNA-guided endonuclease Cas9 [Mycoplasmopsis maculosa]VEU75558.1 Uncharacterized protein conserved in bacteria [Mycoplasmopsis maculosa]